MINYIKNQCIKSKVNFEERVVGKTPWSGRSILMSEGFSLCVICDLYNVDLLIESGIFNGRSTQIWANYLDIPIITIDVLIRNKARRILSKYKNLRIIKGNSMSLLPNIIERNSDKRIGVFIDGPKGKAGINLLKKCYLYDNVVFSSTHDIHNSSNRRKAFDEAGCDYKFLTEEGWFVENYKYLDVDESNRGDGQRMLWKPYEKIDEEGNSRSLGSYGPTIGFLLKEIDREVL